MNYELLKKKLVKDIVTFFISAALLWLANWTFFLPLIYILNIVVIVYFAKIIVGSMNIVFHNQTPKKLRSFYLLLAILLVLPVVVYAFLAIQAYGGVGNFISLLHTPLP